MQAAIIVYIISKNRNARNESGLLKSVTEFFVGAADDIGPYEFLNVISSTSNGNFTLQDLSQEDFLNQLKANLDKLPSPRIISATSAYPVVVPPISEELANKILSEDRGMRLIGQRYIVDSHIFSKLVSFNYEPGKESVDTLPFTAIRVQNRGIVRAFPRGLDLMALLGSNVAKHLLNQLGDSNFTGYQEVFDKLQNDLESYDANKWTRDLYHAWLYSLRSLLGCFDSKYPTFMLTEALKYKELGTALSSWAQLRHDTILYAKQSYTPLLGLSQPSETKLRGYIEPIPELYGRLLDIVNSVESFLSRLEKVPEKIQNGVKELKRILRVVVTITRKELQNQSLSDEEYDFIKEYGHTIYSLLSSFESHSYKPRDMMVVADVHTDLNSNAVLEQGIGYLKILLVAFKLPDGKISIGAGPVLSYYEFKQPLHNRLNDESWKKVLNSESCPSEPEWISEYCV